MEQDEFLSNTADGVCAVTPEGKVIVWNRGAEKILGYQGREALGRLCCEMARTLRAAPSGLQITIRSPDLRWPGRGRQPPLLA